jgi:hypothetical protein
MKMFCIGLYLHTVALIKRASQAWSNHQHRKLCADIDEFSKTFR